MSYGTRVLRIAAFAFLSLFLTGAIEFILKVDPEQAVISQDFIEVTLIVGAVYGFLGTIGAILLSLVIYLLRRTGRNVEIEFSLFLLWSLAAFAYAGFIVNTGWLHGLPMSHPISLIVTLFLLILCVAIFSFLYRILKPVLFRGITRTTTSLILIFLYLSFGPLLHAGEGPVPEPKPGRQRASDLNVLLITVDTLRPDHLGCYGHEGIRTPTIDALAREGALFENAVTSIPITLPSHASIMTGLYPPTHGIRFNGAFALSDSIVTLAEILGDAGYTTGAVVGSYALDSEFGLDQGFQIYDDSYPAGNVLKFKYPKLWSSLSRLLLGQILARTLPLDIIFSEPQRRADKVTRVTLDWLEVYGQEKFFLWLHYFDPHTPYDPPSGSGLGHPNTGIPDRSLITRDPPYRYWWGELESLGDVYSRYDGEIEYTDHWLSPVFGELNRLGVREKTLVIFTADHGECLWEHDQPGHGYSVFDSELRVPLIVSLPGTIPAGIRIPNLIELVDLLPSILDLLEIGIPHPVQGQSFLNILGGEAHIEERTAYCETLWPPKPEDRRRGLRSTEWKYFTAPTGDSEFLFHLPTDPDELQDLQAERPDLIGTFREKLIMISSELGDKGGVLPEMSEEVEARLRALGYIR